MYGNNNTFGRFPPNNIAANGGNHLSESRANGPFSQGPAKEHLGTYRIGNYKDSDLPTQAVVSAIPLWKECPPNSIVAKEKALHLSVTELRVEDYFLIRNKKLEANDSANLQKSIRMGGFNESLLNNGCYNLLPFSQDRTIDLDSLRNRPFSSNNSNNSPYSNGNFSNGSSGNNNNSSSNIFSRNNNSQTNNSSNTNQSSNNVFTTNNQPQPSKNNSFFSNQTGNMNNNQSQGGNFLNNQRRPNSSNNFSNNNINNNGYSGSNNNNGNNNSFMNNSSNNSNGNSFSSNVFNNFAGGVQGNNSNSNRFTNTNPPNSNSIFANNSNGIPIGGNSTNNNNPAIFNSNSNVSNNGSNNQPFNNAGNKNNAFNSNNGNNNNQNQNNNNSFNNQNSNVFHQNYNNTQGNQQFQPSNQSNKSLFSNNNQNDSNLPQSFNPMNMFSNNSLEFLASQAVLFGGIIKQIEQRVLQKISPYQAQRRQTYSSQNSYSSYSAGQYDNYQEPFFTMSLAKNRKEEQAITVTVVQKKNDLPRNSQITQQRQSKVNQNPMMNENSLLPVQSRIKNQDESFKSIKVDRYSSNNKCKSVLIHNYQGQSKVYCSVRFQIKWLDNLKGMAAEKRTLVKDSVLLNFDLTSQQGLEMLAHSLKEIFPIIRSDAKIVLNYSQSSLHSHSALLVGIIEQRLINLNPNDYEVYFSNIHKSFIENFTITKKKSGVKTATISWQAPICYQELDFSIPDVFNLELSELVCNIPSLNSRCRITFEALPSKISKLLKTVGKIAATENLRKLIQSKNKEEKIFELCSIHDDGSWTFIVEKFE